jgi:hypothetical protein
VLEGDQKKFPLSHSAVSRRIDDKRCNIECELIKGIKSSRFFAMQVDESTDVGLSVLLPFVIYIYIYIYRSS